MGEKEMLIEIVETAREDLKKAQDAADNTKRPDNACPAHDVQFALTKALTHGIDTLLMLKLEEMRDENAHGKEQAADADVIPTKAKFGAMLATALIDNMKTLIITLGLAVTILGLAVIFTRQIAEATGFVQTTGQIAHGGSK